MQINIAVVSHGHFGLIRDLNCLPQLAKEANIEVCVLDNIGESGFNSWCDSQNISYLTNSEAKGFGENNNQVYTFFSEQFNSSKKAKFLVLNSDVQVSAEAINDLASKSDQKQAKISTLNLYSDSDFNTYDNCIRHFPTSYNYFQSLVLNRNDSIIDKSTVTEPILVDWAAGSFLLFDFEYFGQLDGFDEKYFMYCEDVDICHRSSSLYNERVLFCPNIKAIHLAQHASRSAGSKHLIWHLKSMCRYLFKKRKLSKLAKNQIEIQ
ncbi:MAG: glycosyltransferase family 2 protein [Gammaproteobacteria bacterium]|nr:glycosyltransferase family 2 protein [Gammaproteobacteria bacterium]